MIKLKHLFLDKKGKVVIYQPPNWSESGWIISFIATYFVKTSTLESVLIGLGTIFLLIWSYLEITDGVNYFRRVLGITGLVASLFFIRSLL